MFIMLKKTNKKENIYKTKNINKIENKILINNFVNIV